MVIRMVSLSHNISSYLLRARRKVETDYAAGLDLLRDFDKGIACSVRVDL